MRLSNKYGEPLSFFGEPEPFYCRRCGMYLGIYDKGLVVKCSMCGAITTKQKGVINYFEKQSPEIKKWELKNKIKKFQDLFEYGQEKKIKK